MSSVSCVAIVSVKLKACAVVGYCSSTSSPSCAAANAFALWFHHRRDVSCSRGPNRCDGCRAVENKCERRHHCGRRSVEPGQTQRRRDALHPLLMAGSRIGESFFSLGAQVDERSQIRLPVNVVLLTLQPQGEEREAVESGVHRAPSDVTIFAPPSIAARQCSGDGDAQGNAGSTFRTRRRPGQFMEESVACVTVLGVFNGRICWCGRFPVFASRTPRSSMSSQRTSPVRSTCWQNPNNVATYRSDKMPLFAEWRMTVIVLMVTVVFVFLLAVSMTTTMTVKNTIAMADFFIR